MNSNRPLAQTRHPAVVTQAASGLANRLPWIVSVLKEMQQTNAIVEQRYGRSRAMWRDHSRPA